MSKKASKGYADTCYSLFYFGLTKQAACQVKPRLVSDLTYDRLIGKSYLQAWECISNFLIDCFVENGVLVIFCYSKLLPALASKFLWVVDKMSFTAVFFFVLSPDAKGKFLRTNSFLYTEHQTS